MGKKVPGCLRVACMGCGWLAGGRGQAAAPGRPPVSVRSGWLIGWLAGWLACWRDEGGGGIHGAGWRRRDDDVRGNGNRTEAGSLTWYS